MNPIRVLTTAVVGVAMTGCVAQEKYNALRLDRDRLQEQLQAAQNDAAAARAEADSSKQLLASLQGGGASAQQLIAQLTEQNAALQRELADLNNKYREALGRTNNGIALPEPLDSALRQLAKDNPDLLEFDSARGVLTFKNDVTFASGDATLTGRGAEAIRQFANILNQQARGYEFIVAGHTDNARVQNPETIRKGHKDNWYLSAHRAITVAEALISAQVSPARMGVTGYADQRPVAPNTSPAGMARNRRVEVVILPTPTMSKQ